MEIEYVCKGNNGRSPTLEAYTTRYVFENNLDNLIIVSSSGVIVDNLEELYGQEIFKLMDHEREIRDAILAENGLKCKEKREQTVARNVDLILTLTSSLIEDVEEVYDGSVYTPKICTVEEYSGVDGIYEGTLKGGEERFRLFIDTVKKAVPKLIERAVNEMG